MKLHLIKTSDDTLYQVIHQEPETKPLDVEKMKNKIDKKWDMSYKDVKFSASPTS